MSRCLSTTAIVASAFAVALSAVACSNDNRNDRATSQSASAPAATAPGATANNASQNMAVTLTGCLQQGSGSNDFILTPTRSQASRSVGTSGSATAAPQSDVVGQEQLKAAEHDYKLNGDSDQLKKLVGAEIRVSGRLASRGDLTAQNHPEGTTAQNKATGTSGRSNQNRQDIDQNDLAKVDVDSVTAVADTCPPPSQSGASKSPSHAKQPRRRK